MTELSGFIFPEEVVIENEFIDSVSGDILEKSLDGTIILRHQEMPLRQLQLKTDMSYTKYTELRELLSSGSLFSLSHEGLSASVAKIDGNFLTFDPAVHAPERTPKMYGFVTVNLVQLKGDF